MTTTFVTVVRPPKADFEALSSAVAVLARGARATFRRLFQLGRPPAEVKREVCFELGILARHWSGCRVTAIQSLRSWREGGRERLRTLEHRLEDLRRRWPEERRPSREAPPERGRAAEGGSGHRPVGEGACGPAALVLRRASAAPTGPSPGMAAAAGRRGAVLRGDGQVRRQRGCTMALRQPASPASAQLGGTRRRARRRAVQSTRRGRSRACDGPAGAGDVEGEAAAERQGAAVRDAGAAGAGGCWRRRQRRSRCRPEQGPPGVGERLAGRACRRRGAGSASEGPGRTLCSRPQGGTRRLGAGSPDRAREPGLSEEEVLAEVVRAAFRRDAVDVPDASGVDGDGAGGPAGGCRGSVRRSGVVDETGSLEVPGAPPPGYSPRGGVGAWPAWSRFRRASARGLPRGRRLGPGAHSGVYRYVGFLEGVRAEAPSGLARGWSPPSRGVRARGAPVARSRAA